jgi:hypothetical protein
VVCSSSAEKCPRGFLDVADLDDSAPTAALTPLEGSEQAVVPTLLVGHRAPTTFEHETTVPGSATARIVIGLEPITPVRTIVQVPPQMNGRVAMSAASAPKMFADVAAIFESAWRWLPGWLARENVTTDCLSQRDVRGRSMAVAAESKAEAATADCADTPADEGGFDLVAMLIDAVFADSR